jgi:hypothetical protein
MVKGTAVYKARTLWTNFNPMAQYYDRLTCVQNATANKGGAYNEIVNLDSLYETQMNESMKALEEYRNYIVDDLISIYPNPTTDYIIVENATELVGEFRLLNSLGEVILTENLNNNKQTIKLNNLSNGIYHYEIEMVHKKKVVGKLTILN